MSSILLQLNDIYHDFGGTNIAVNNLQLSVNEGEIIALVGSSGCGKTTLLKIICGLITPDRGIVLYREKPVTDILPSAAFVFQDYSSSLMPWRNVWSNVQLGLENPNYAHLDQEQIVTDMLKLMHLQNEKYMMPYELSGGMKQRVAIARSLAISPDILLMDEPFGSLDEISRARLQDEVLAIHSNSQPKRTIITVTHDIDEAVYMSHRIVVLSPRTSNIVKIIDNNLDWPRDQITTRLTQRFSTLRTEIYKIMSQEVVV